MAGEFNALWLNENQPQYEINAANLTFMAPSVMCMSKRILTPVSGQRRQITVSGDLFIKVVTGGTHRAFRNNNALTIDPQTIMDQGNAFEPGKDYYLYIVQNTGTADLVCSLNSTFPLGATAENSRKIGGFHTLCLDVGSGMPSHPLTGYLSGDVLPNSVHCLKFHPSCSAEGMVYSPDADFWVDIYMQSGSGANTKSVFGGTVTKSQPYNTHQQDLAAVGKRMLWDNEFTAAAWGTLSFKGVAGGADPITTGGKTFTTGERIISNIGCEDMCGCYWQWINNEVDNGGTATNTTWGQQYNGNAAIAGANWSNGAAWGGPLARSSNTRLTVNAYHSSRGAARAIHE